MILFTLSLYWVLSGSFSAIKFKQNDIAPPAKREGSQLNIDWEEMHIPAELNTTQIEFWEVP